MKYADASIRSLLSGLIARPKKLVALSFPGNMVEFSADPIEIIPRKCPNGYILIFDIDTDYTVIKSGHRYPVTYSSQTDEYRFACKEYMYI